MQQISMDELLNDHTPVVKKKFYKFKAIRRDASLFSKHKAITTDIKPENSEEMYKTYRSWIWNN